MASKVRVQLWSNGKRVLLEAVSTMMRQQEQVCSTVSDRGDETDKVRAWLEVQQGTRYEPTIGPKHGKRGAPCGTKGYHT